MTIKRIFATSLVVSLMAGTAYATDVKIGVLNDRSGIYADLAGEGAAAHPLGAFDELVEEAQQAPALVALERRVDVEGGQAAHRVAHDLAVREEGEEQGDGHVDELRAGPQRLGRYGLVALAVAGVAIHGPSLPPAPFAVRG